MGNNIFTSWHTCHNCKEIKHGFEFDILDNGARSGACDKCKVESVCECKNYTLEEIFALKMNTSKCPRCKIKN